MKIDGLELPPEVLNNVRGMIPVVMDAINQLMPTAEMKLVAFHTISQMTITNPGQLKKLGDDPGSLEFVRMMLKYAAANLAKEIVAEEDATKSTTVLN